MGEKDIRTYSYMSNNERFADLFNYYLNDGKKVILPENLQEVDTRELCIPKGKGKAAQKFRDILKEVRAMKDNTATYLLLGVENQSEQNYAMPVQVMLYDTMQYEDQIKAREKARKENGANSGLLPGEYMGRLRKEEKLTPVITLVVFWSAEKWDGPTSLLEMFDDVEDEFLPFISDYKINVLSPQMIADEDFSKFETDLAEVFKFIKHSKNKEAFRKMIKEENDFNNLDWESAELIKKLTNAKFELVKEGDVVNMCLAEDLWVEEECHNRAVEIAKALIKLGKNTLEEIADATQLPIEEIQELMITE